MPSDTQDISPQSRAIAGIVDRFPDQVRERIAAALRRVACVHGLPEKPVGTAMEPDTDAPTVWMAMANHCDGLADALGRVPPARRDGVMAHVVVFAYDLAEEFPACAKPEHPNVIPLFLPDGARS